MSFPRTFAKINMLFQKKPIKMMVITIVPFVLTIGETRKSFSRLPKGIYQIAQNITYMPEFETYSSPR